MHDHVTWCVFEVVQGAGHEELFALRRGGSSLEQVGRLGNSVRQTHDLPVLSAR